jgi:hypothetical protein
MQLARHSPKVRGEFCTGGEGALGADEPEGEWGVEETGKNRKNHG